MQYKTRQKQENISKVKELFYEYSLGARPFLKWAGGKNQLLPVFKQLYPSELKEKKIKNYYEPFVSCGIVFFSIIQNINIKSAFLWNVIYPLRMEY